MLNTGEMTRRDFVRNFVLIILALLFGDLVWQITREQVEHIVDDVDDKLGAKFKSRSLSLEDFKEARRLILNQTGKLPDTIIVSPQMAKAAREFFNGP